MDSRVERGPEGHLGITELREAWREREELRQMLAEVQWVEFTYGQFCLFCLNERELGHTDDCRWARMMGGDR